MHPHEDIVLDVRVLPLLFVVDLKLFDLFRIKFRVESGLLFFDFFWLR
jgi:hypothetical protein